MFAVIFEVHPKPDQKEAYFGFAKMLRPELEQVDGFVENIRYKSLTREGWVLSLSIWRDEKAVVRWRTAMRHHEIQDRARADVFLDYHLRVGQLTQDTQVPPGYALHEQRLDETEVGEGTTVSLVDAHGMSEIGAASPTQLAARLGLQQDAGGLVAWDVFEAVLTPGDVMLMLTWRDDTAARSPQLARPDETVRQRRVRIVRDYGMFDRREAPQYYPDVRRP